jgi:glutathione S-transferase
VPVLVVDGQALTQIVAICDFLDRSFPQANLLPKDSWARAQALSDLTWFNNTVHPTFTHFFMPQKFAADDAAQAAMKAKSISDYSKLVERIQTKLSAAQPFLGGSSPNLLDAYALVLYRWGGLTGINPATIPAYYDYVEKLAKHPAMAAAIERERIPLQTFKAA